MNRTFLWGGFFCMLGMAFLLLVWWLEYGDSAPRGSERGAVAVRESGRTSSGAPASPTDGQTQPRPRPSDSGTTPDDSSTPASTPAPSSPQPSARPADAGPRPDDSEGPVDYAWVQSPPDCSQWRHQTDQAKHLARQTDKALLQLGNLSAEDEDSMGQELWKAFLRDEESKLITEGPMVDYVRATASAMLPFVKRKEPEYKFFVYDSDDINAFAMPGGYVVINKGLIASIENQARLASVVGHEIAHNDLKHCISNLLIAKQVLGGVNDITLTLVWFFRLPLSSENELEADQWGMELAMAGGFSPFQAPAFMDTLPAGENWSESFEMPIKIGDPVLDGLADVAAKLILDEVENMVDTHPKPPLRACTMRNWLSDHFKEKGNSWYLVGAARHRQAAR